MHVARLKQHPNITFLESVGVAGCEIEIEALPSPIKVFGTFPSVPALIRHARISRYARQVPIEVHCARFWKIGYRVCYRDPAKRLREFWEEKLVQM